MSSILFPPLEVLQAMFSEISDLEGQILHIGLPFLSTRRDILYHILYP